jgi:hypothetical protein
MGDTLNTSPTLLVTVAGTYILELSDPQNGCLTSDTITVVDLSVFPEIIDAPDLQLGCDETTGVLDASLMGSVSGMGFNWSTQDGSITGSASVQQITYNGAGTYVIEVTHLASACKDRDTIVINEIGERPEQILADVSAANCIGVSDGMIGIANIQGGTPPYVVYLNGIHMQGLIFNDLATGVYMLQIEDALENNSVQVS